VQAVAGKQVPFGPVLVGPAALQEEQIVRQSHYRHYSPLQIPPSLLHSNYKRWNP
jgi:hypothetical protein